MIIQALNKLYDRLESDPGYGLPQPGYSIQKVSFCIVLHPNGQLHDIEDVRETDTSGKRPRQVPRLLAVPGEAKPSGSGLNPCPLWDNAVYLLGWRKDDSNPERSRQCQAASAKLHSHLAHSARESSIAAVATFLETWPSIPHEPWKEKLEAYATHFGVFRVLPVRQFVHESAAFASWWGEQEANDSEQSTLGQCLATGIFGPIARLAEPAIKGVRGAAPGGAKLASFNAQSFESYGKSQTFNSPVSIDATFRYCNALNALLGSPKSTRHTIHTTETTIVFWTERETASELLFGTLLSGLPSPDENEDMDEDPVLRQRLESVLNIFRGGGGASVDELGDDPNAFFYVLGLSGNRTRLAVRFWHVGTIHDMVVRLQNHYNALRLHGSRGPHEEFPAAWRLLVETARKGADIAPLLPGALMRAVVTGGAYPIALYSAVLNRIRADQIINYTRASILKAVLVRNFNHTITMSLDHTAGDTAYLLGRLFAALEKTQEDALPGINSTIRDRYFSAASTTPSTVFPRLLRTYQHHLSKLDGGRRINRERLVQAVHSDLANYPDHLTLEHQGRFVIGYYHQRQAFFTRKADAIEHELSEATAH